MSNSYNGPLLLLFLSVTIFAKLEQIKMSAWYPVIAATVIWLKDQPDSCGYPV